jgi:DNA-3-methyladenine glycosylase
MDALARSLLGKRVRASTGAGAVGGIIVETEAYLGPEDPASHAATSAGITDRNRLMFGPAGLAYVYRVYGMHWCLNAVGGREGEVGAVLIRGLEIVEGRDVAVARRGREDHLADGPGKACQALGVTGALHGHDLSTPPLEILRGEVIDDDRIRRTGRVGIRSGVSWPLRYILTDSSGVSAARVHPGDASALPEPFREPAPTTKRR